MKKKYLKMLIMGCICLLFLSACSAEKETTAVTDENTASDIPRTKYGSVFDEESGWYYEFYYLTYPEGVEPYKVNDEELHYRFIGVNLRYRYSEDCWAVSYQSDVTQPGNEKFYRYRYKNGVQIWGQTDAQKRDRAVLNTIFPNDRSLEDVLKVSAEQYSFETMDGGMIYDLIHTTLEGPFPGLAPEKKTQAPLAETASLVEGEYIDGYKFQIIYEVGRNIETYIDVLYQTGPEYNDYVQLSDLVEEGKASEEQQTLWDLLKRVRADVRAEARFEIADLSFKDQIIAGVELSRLYDFLIAIDTGNYYDYNAGSEMAPWITEEISKEEFLAAGNKLPSWYGQ